MRKIRGPIQRIDVPAILAFHPRPRSLFAHNSVVRPLRTQPLYQQLFALPVGNRHQVRFAFIFRCHAVLIVRA